MSNINEINNITAEIEKLKSEISVFNEKVHFLTNTVNNKNNEIEVLQINNSNLATDVETFNRIIDDLRNEILNTVIYIL